MIRALAVVLCLAAVPALAFEGVIETKMTASSSVNGKDMGVSGTGRISVKGLNTRMDQEMTMPGVSGPVKQTLIHRNDEPNTTYILHENTRTYSKIEADKGGQTGDAEQWTVKKLGKDTVAGRSTEHVQVTRTDNSEHPMEVWVDTHLISSGDLEKVFSEGRRGNGGWWQALKKAGVAGIPLKVVASQGPGGGGMTWQATSVKEQSVPDSAFKLPSGYTESKAGMGGAMTPEQQKQMREQFMQKLTPEQRQQMDEMMKKRQGPGGQ